MSDLAINVIAKNGASGVLNSVASDLKKVETAGKSAGASLQNIGKGLSSAGTVLTAGLTLPLVGLGAAAIKASNDLNKGMANVASLGVATARVNELKTAVQSMAIATGKSTDDLANGLYQVESAFGDTKDTAKILEINAKAAAAGLAQTTDSINLTSAVTKAFGDTSATAVQHVTDLALKAVELGQTTFPELAGSIGLVAPLAQNMGVNLNEMFAVMATGAGVTGTTSQVATQFRGILQSMMAPTATMTKLLQANGYANGAAMLKQLGFEKSVQLIIATAKKSGLPLQQFIGSIEGQTLALSLAGPQADKYMQNLEGMGKAAGKTDEAFKAQTEGINAVGFKMEQAKVKMTVFFQKLGDAMGPALLALADLIMPLGDRLLALADKFQQLDPSTQKWIVGIGVAAAALGPLLFGLGKFVSMIGFALPFITGIGSALSGLLLPLGLLAVAYRLNLFGLQTFVNNGLSRVRAAAPLAGDAIREFVAQVTGIGINIHDTTEGIQHFVAALTGSEQVGIRTANWIGDIGNATGVMQVALQKFINGPAVHTAMSGLSESAGKIKTAFTDLFSGNIGVDQFIGKISAALSGIPTMVRTLFASADFAALKTGIVAALGLDKISFDFAGIKDKVSTAVGSALSSVDWSTITADFKSLPLWVSRKLSLVDWSAITTTFSSLQALVSTKLGAIDWSLITTDFSTLKTWVSGKLGAIDWSTITATFSSLPLWVSEKLSLVDWSTITTTFSSFTSWAAGKLSALDWSTITATFSTLTGWVGEKLNAIDWSSATVTFSTLTTWVSEKLGKLDFSTITTTFSGITTTIDSFNTSLQGLTAEGGGITKLQTMILGAVKGISDTIAGVDANKVASVGLSFGNAITSLLNAFTTLSDLGNDNVGKATSGISSLIQSILGLATSFTTGLDATKISESAAKFAASYVDEIKKVLGSADLPGIAEAASSFVLALSGKFKEALSGEGISTLATSLSGLADAVVKQLAAVLGDEKLVANLNDSFQNLAEGIASGLAKAFENPDLAKTLGGGTAKLGSSILSFVAKEVTTALTANLKPFDTSSLGSALFGTGIQIEKGGLADSAAKFVEGFRISFQKGIDAAAEKSPLFSNVEPFMAKFREMDAAFTSWVDGLISNLKRIPGVTSLFPQLAEPKSEGNTGAAKNFLPVNYSDRSVRTANDFSTALSELNTKIASGLLIKTESPIAITASTAIPVAQESTGWFDSFLNKFAGVVAPLLQGRALQNAAGASTVGGAPLLNVPLVATIDPGSITAVGQSVASAVKVYGPPAELGPQRATATDFASMLDRLNTASQSAHTLQAATIQANSVIVTGAAGGLGAGTQPAAPPVPPFQWPPLPAFAWPTLPTFAWPALPAFTWPSYPAFTWPAYAPFAWPAYPAFVWPSIPTPVWLSSLISAIASGASAAAGTNRVFIPGNASGTSAWLGGPTWVGEKGAEAIKLPTGKWLMAGASGPQLMDLPAGTQIYKHEDTVKMMNGTVNAIGQNADGTGPLPPLGGPQLGPVLHPLAPIAAPQLGPMTDHLKNIDKSTATSLKDAKRTADVLTYQGGPYLGAPNVGGSLRPLPPSIGAPGLGPISQNLKETSRHLSITSANTRQTDALRLAREQAAIAQRGIPANQPFAAMLKSQEQMGRELAKSFQGTTAEFKSFLQSVPGLFKSSSVTQDDMNAAKAGTYKDKADEWLRRLTDEVLNGVDWKGVDIKDAALRAGLDPGLPAKAILEMVTQKWNDQSLFADKKNLDLINMDAIKAQVAQQAASKLGQQNIFELFGIKPDQAQGQAVALGNTVGAGINQGVSDVFASAGKTKDGKGGIDIVSGLANTLNTQLAGTDAFDGIGQDILQKIADSWKGVSKGVDMTAGISSALTVQLATPGAIDALKNVGGKIAQILKTGIDEYFKNAAIADAIAKSIKPTSPATPDAVPVTKKAVGTYSWQGGRVMVGETGPEILDLPARTRIYGRGETAAMAGGGSITNNWYVTVANDIDINALAYKVSDIQRRRKS